MQYHPGLIVIKSPGSNNEDWSVICEELSHEQIMLDPLIDNSIEQGKTTEIPTML